MNLDRATELLSKFSIRSDKEGAGRICDFKLNECQLLIMERLKELQEAGKPLWAIVLKSRRVGVSTLAEGLLNCHCISNANARSLVLAHLFPSSRVLFNMAKLMRDSLPFDAPRPTLRQLEYVHKAGNSTLEITTAKSTQSGRGMSFSAIHFSEAGFYEDEGEVFTSLLQTVPHSPDTMILIESTANGKVGNGKAFYDMWCSSLEGRTQFEPIFIPWTMDPTCIYDPEMAKDAPCDDDEKELIEAGVSLEQLAWRRVVMETKCGGSVDKFKQEYPFTWEEAFISYENAAFNSTERRWAKAWLDGKDKDHEETRIIFRRRNNNYSWNDGMGNPKLKAGPVDFIPSRDSKDAAVSLWEEYDPKCWYYIGADVARGDKAGDFSAFVGWNGSTGDQAFRFAAKIGPVELANQLDMVGREYGNALVNIEVTGGFGGWCQTVLRDRLQYPNFYRWKGSGDDKLAGKAPQNTLGWETQHRSRKNLFAAFREALRYRKIRIFDKNLFIQIESATYDEYGREEIQAEHDDILMAAMIGWIAVEQYPPPNRRRKPIVVPWEGMVPVDEDGEIDIQAEISKRNRSWLTVSDGSFENTLRRHYAVVRTSKKRDRLEGV